MTKENSMNQSALNLPPWNMLRRQARRYGARRYRRGFSLFGVLLGLGLAAVVIVGAVGTYNAARESANRTAALTLLSQLRANVEAAYAGASSYGNNADLVAALDRRGGIPGGARVLVGRRPPSAIPSAGRLPSPAGRAALPIASKSSSTMSTMPFARRWAMPSPGAAAPGPG